MENDLDTITAHLRSLHGPSITAILAYGSCLRENGTRDGLIDLYLLTDTYKSVSANPLSRLFCRLIPPNVLYAECGVAGATLRAKYAILPLHRFAQLAKVSNPYIWARFAQPARVVYARDSDATAAMEKALAACAQNFWQQAQRTSHSGDDALQAAERLLIQTYATELRPENASRARLIVEANRDYYTAQATHHLGLGWRSTNTQPANWKTRRFIGKALSVARLIKAGFTFQGGADYVAWKIARHSGVQLTITDWQRRHPILGALMLLPQVLRQKGLR
jgi:hypothetical protein